MHQNFKVFIKDRQVVFTERLNVPLREKHVIPHHYQNMKLLMLEFERFLKAKKSRTLLVIRRKNADQIFIGFLGNFKITKAAGGAVINKNEEVLMIHRHGRWDLPKGKKDKGERNRETALREVMEETGLQQIKVKRKLMITYHFYRRNRRLIIKKTHWYLMKAKQKQELKPATDEGISKIKWMPFEKARHKSNNIFRSITEVLCKAINCEPDQGGGM